jgi:leucyl/phenylalanyl-tRNA--protein transferase
MRKLLGRGGFSFSTDRCFDKVIEACAHTRKQGTWITPAMIQAYKALHELGYAHSVECWQNDTLIGGLYGVHLGAVFCGESMFSYVSNASKATFIILSRTLQHAGFKLIDCQLPNPHLNSLGAIEMERSEFLNKLQALKNLRTPWPQQQEFDIVIANSAEKGSA